MKLLIWFWHFVVLLGSNLGRYFLLCSTLTFLGSSFTTGSSIGLRKDLLCRRKKYSDPVRIWKKETNLEGICSCTLWADALIHCNSFQAACVHRLTQLIMECFHSWNLGFNLGAQVGDSLGSIKGHLETQFNSNRFFIRTWRTLSSAPDFGLKMTDTSLTFCMM